MGELGIRKVFVDEDADAGVVEGPFGAKRVLDEAPKRGVGLGWGVEG